MSNAVETNAIIAAGVLDHTGDRGGMNWQQAGVGPVSIAIVDEQPFNCDHVGFTRRIPDGSWASRIVTTQYCTAAGCSWDPDKVCGDESDVGSHATQTSWAAAGSIMDQQDPRHIDSAVPEDDTDLLRRSGVAWGTNLIFVRIEVPGDDGDADMWRGNTDPVGSSGLDAEINCVIVSAIEAVAYRADILNLSLGMQEDPKIDPCDPGYDPCGVGRDIEALTDSGTLVVKSAGNYGGIPSDACTVTPPAMHDDVLAVGALATAAAPNMESVPRAPYSSTGVVKLPIIGAYPPRYAFYHPIGGLAPAEHRFHFNGERDGYWSLEPTEGTSFAAPIVSGLAALVRDHLESRGWAFDNARVLGLFMYLAGDGWSGNNSNVSQEASDYLSAMSGFGRTRLQLPSSEFLVEPWAWGYHVFHLKPGETVFIDVNGLGAEPKEMTQFKWVLFTNVESLVPAPWVLAEVYNACSIDERIALANPEGVVRYRAEISGDELPERPCLQLRISGKNLPAEGVWVYESHYFHSGDPRDH